MSDFYKKQQKAKKDLHKAKLQLDKVFGDIEDIPLGMNYMKLGRQVANAMDEAMRHINNLSIYLNSLSESETKLSDLIPEASHPTITQAKQLYNLIISDTILTKSDVFLSKKVVRVRTNKISSHSSVLDKIYDIARANKIKIKTVSDRSLDDSYEVTFTLPS